MALIVMVVLLLLVYVVAVSSGTWIHIKPYWKLLGGDSSHIALAAQMHFPIRRVLLLANTHYNQLWECAQSRAFRDGLNTILYFLS